MEIFKFLASDEEEAGLTLAQIGKNVNIASLQPSTSLQLMLI